MIQHGSVYSMSACETTAEAFFERLLQEKTDLLLDVRRRNTNQLCGFTKQGDLAYFMKKIIGADYIHDLDFAPSQKLLDDYLKHVIDWAGFCLHYKDFIEKEDKMALFEKRYGQYRSIAILGAGTKKRRSHSELLEAMVCDERQK